MKTLSPIALLAGLGACAAQGAPSFILFGAYFPAWMFCVVLGIAIALASRVGMVATGLSDTMPFQLFVCASNGLIVAVSAWLLWFGR